MIGLQLIGIIFGIFLAYQSFLFYKKKEIDKRSLFFWSLVSLAILVVNIFPSSLDKILESLGFIRALDFFTIMGFLVVLTLLLYFNRIIQKYQKKIDKLVEKIALEDKE